MAVCIKAQAWRLLVLVQLVLLQLIQVNMLELVSLEVTNFQGGRIHIC